MSDRYKARRVGGEERGELRLATACVLLGLALGGCSIGLGDDGPATTGSIAPAAKPAAETPLGPDLGVEDWRRAKAALATALDPQGSGTAVKWENPDTDTSGSFTPVAQPFVRGSDICRAFLATITQPSRTVSLQGTGCRLAGDEWRLEGVRPWRKPA